MYSSSASLAALLCLGAVEEAAGHGWLTSPPARNSQSGPKNGYCPHCGNGNGICGDGNQWPAGSDYLNFYNGPVTSWVEGSVVAVDVKVTAHHKGHYEFSICDKVVTSALPDAQACLDKHILQRATAEEAGVTDCQPGDKRAVCQPVDGRHMERFYLPPKGFSPDGTDMHKIYLKLPSGLKCEACTLQWRWWSANSCIPAADYACFKQDLDSNGFSSADWGLGSACPGGGCDRCGCGEEFRNCADISILGNDGTTPSSTTSTTSAPGVVTTTSSPMTTAPTTSSVPSSTTSESSRCKAVAVNGQMLGATDEKCNEACALVPAGMWPCLQEGPCQCSDKQVPTPATPAPTMSPGFLTPAPTTAPRPSTPAPTPAAGGAGSCVANPNLNRGVTDSSCARCADGYQFWPCNEADLCIGDGCSR